MAPRVLRLLPALCLLVPLSAPAAAATAPAAAQAQAPAAAPSPVSAADRWRPRPPRELLVVEKVVDGDTIHVRRGDTVEKLRLLSIDTEEKLTGRPSLSPTKPETLYGEETARWAREFFGARADDDGRARVGLLFPGGEERRDPYGRLLCHVLLPDGTDYNLLVVRLGKSPYFNKYGDSELCHAAFVDAQAEARAARRGVWDPATNRPADPDAPAARRPYDRLLPWWDARAEAVAAFRAARAREPERVVAADDPDALDAALARAAGDPEATVRAFGEVDRFFDEDDGSLTVLFRGADRARLLRAVVPADARPRVEGDAALALRSRGDELRQNYLWVEGRLERGPRGPRIVAGDPAQWSPGGPEPDLPAAEPERAEPAAAGAAAGAADDA